MMRPLTKALLFSMGSLIIIIILYSYIILKIMAPYGVVHIVRNQFWNILTPGYLVKRQWGS